MSNLLTDYWTGKSVLITGASSGIGWAVAEALAPYNVRFGLLARREEKLQELADRHKDSGSTFWTRKCDVTDREQVTSVVKDFADAAGGIDVAWVNSGIGGATSFSKWDWDFAERMMATNLMGAMYTTQACLEVMVPQGSGAIAGIGSAASMRGMPARSIYSITKIGLDYYLESLAAELPGIQFTTIHPGYVDTPFNRGRPNRIFLMTADRAAQLMIKAVARRKRRYIYPFRMKLLYKFVHGAPSSIYRWGAHLALPKTRPTVQTG